MIHTEKWDLRFLEMARLVGSWSKDPSTHVGAVVARDKRVVSLGFNGFAAGAPDDEALYADRDEKLSRVLHAEVNAVLFAQRDLAGATLYTVPLAPCDRCAVLMLQSGLRRFVFPRLPADLEGRWGESVARTKRYFEECGATWSEVEQCDTAGATPSFYVLHPEQDALREFFYRVGDILNTTRGSLDADRLWQAVVDARESVRAVVGRKP